MQMRSSRRLLSPAVLALGSVAVISACSGDNLDPLAGANASDLTVGLDLSKATAAPGEQIAIAVNAAGRTDLGGIQGTLRYDPAKLTYVGQAPEGGKVTIVNASVPGQVRLVSYQGGTGIGTRSGALVFQVKGRQYATDLGFDFQMATDVNGAVELAKYRKGAIAEASNLVVPSNAKPMKMEDWNLALYPQQVAAEAPVAQSGKGPAFAPGSYLLNLHYGNANLSTENANPATCSSVNVLDASYVANIAVGNNSAQAVDFPTRDPVIAGNVSPNSSPIPGVGSGGSRVIDVLDAQAISNEAVGNLRPVVCDLVPGRGPTPTATVTLSGSITGNRILSKDTLYRLQGIVRVNGGGHLEIQPGTRIEGIYGGPAAAAVVGLIIERDGTIDARGTLLEPIVFSCDQTPKFKGCWGGLVLAGNAIVNASQGATMTSPVNGTRSPTANCNEVVSEGTAGTPAEYRFGGCNDADSSGVLQFVQVEYGGFSFFTNRELNNVTMAGIGNHTVVDHIQAHAGLDDAYEIWGGSFNMKFLYLTANSDDGFDFASGWRGKAQFIALQSDSLDGDKGFEIDNTESAATYNDDGPLVPATTPQIYNVTLIGKADPAGTGGPVSSNNVEGAIHIRRGAHPRIFNVLAEGWPWLVNIDNDVATTGTNAPNSTCLGATNMNTLDTLQFNLGRNFTTIDEPAVEAGQCAPYPVGTSIEDDWWNDAANNNAIAATEPLIAPYNVVTPDFRPVSGAAVFQGASATPPNDGFFDVTANYRGAVAPGTSGTIPWYSGWTRQWTSATTP